MSRIHCASQDKYRSQSIAHSELFAMCIDVHILYLTGLTIIYLFISALLPFL